MADDFQRLAVLIEANTKSYERAMVRLEAKTNKALKGVQKEVGDTGTKFQGLAAKIQASAAASAKAFASGLLAGGVVAFAASATAAVQSTVTALTELKTASQRAGINVEDFQRLTYAAGVAKVSTDALTDGLKEMQLRVDEFVSTGAGSAAESLGRLGFESDDLARRLQNPRDLFLEIIDRTRELGDTAAAIRVFDEVFGGSGGEQFVAFLEQGRDELRRTVDEADDLGHVLDAEVIARAVELDRQFNEIASTVGTTLKGAIVSAAGAMADFIGWYNQALAAGAGTQALVDTALTAGGMNLRGDLANRNFSDFSEFDDLRNRAVPKGDRREMPPVLGPDGKPPTPGVNPLRDLNSDYGIAKKGGRGGKGGGAAKLDDLQREIEAIRERTAAYGFEAEMLGRYAGNADAAAIATDLMVAAMSAGKTVSPEMAAQFDEMALKMAAAKARADEMRDSSERLADAMADVNDFGRDLLGGFIADLRSGKSAAEALEGVISRIADKAIDMALDGLFSSNGGGGLFGSLLGGLFGRDGGGRVNAGQPYIGAERRPEIFVPDTSGSIRRPGDAGTGGGGAPVIIQADFRGADASAVAGISQRLDKMQRELPSLIAGTNRRSQVRGVS